MKFLKLMKFSWRRWSGKNWKSRSLRFRESEKKSKTTPVKKKCLKFLWHNWETTEYVGIPSTTLRSSMTVRVVGGKCIPRFFDPSVQGRRPWGKLTQTHPCRNLLCRFLALPDTHTCVNTSCCNLYSCIICSLSGLVSLFLYNCVPYRIIELNYLNLRNTLLIFFGMPWILMTWPPL